jgi:RNA polymerase sigma factor (sigma-70 family)
LPTLPPRRLLAMPPIRFQTTRWTLVLRAADRHSIDGRKALAEMLELYWYPLYGYLRRQGYDSHEAEDLLQAFIARILEKDLFQDVAAGRGRFRNFLLVSLRRFAASAQERASARKRGGQSAIYSFDIHDADRRYASDPAHELTAERLFDRAWALELLHQALARLNESWETADKARVFKSLKGFLLPQRGEGSYREVADQLGMTEGAVKTAVHRLRAQFRQILCDQVAATLDRDELLEDEIHRLFAALRA